MKSLEEIIQKGNLLVRETGEDGGWGIVYFGGGRKPAMVIFSWGDGWDHVSVSYKNRCCTWDEMCEIKDIFFHEDECAVQYHPLKKDYVNNHPYVLHLWRPQNIEIPMPPRELV
jgi:hypothetical protein